MSIDESLCRCGRTPKVESRLAAAKCLIGRKIRAFNTLTVALEPCSKSEGQLLEDIDQPGGGLQDRDALSQRVFSECFIEQFERAPVGRVLRGSCTQFREALDQFPPVRLGLIIALTKIRALFPRRSRFSFSML
ncbi:MAG TPA: hypothetical protein VHD14_13160 [Pseudolabrys sp.]|nr:hypothetical protein [Pseudolabrys sp.]